MKSFSLSLSLDWRHSLLLLGSALVPILLAISLSGFVPSHHAVPFPGAETSLELLEADSAKRLESLFDGLGYTWPPRGAVPPLAIHHLPADMHTLSVRRKKSLFFRALLPLIVVENERVNAERRWLAEVIRNGYVGTMVQKVRIRKLLAKYSLDADAGIDQGLLERLYRRIDVIPAGLVLAQAANESGWGTSRFSRKANNLFGQWTYNPENGILPLRRREGDTHYVRRFDHLQESVRTYFNNLNRNKAYKPLRQLRAEQRRQGLEPDALTLAGGLVRYSERREEYVADIRALISHNNLNELGPLHLVRFARAD